MINSQHIDEGIVEFRKHYPLPLVRRENSDIVISGVFDLLRSHDGKEYHLEYHLKIVIPESFPFSIPRVYELDRKISKQFHKLEGDALCLGAPLRVKQIIRRKPTILSFFENIVLPYLVAHTRHIEGETMPFGELDHGVRGLYDEYRKMFWLNSDRHVLKLCRFLALSPNRHEKGKPCVCGSGKRFRKCHGPIVSEAGALLMAEDYVMALRMFSEN